MIKVGGTWLHGGAAEPLFRFGLSSDVTSAYVCVFSYYNEYYTNNRCNLDMIAQMKVIKNTEFGCAEVVDDAFERVRVSAGRTHIVI